MHLLPWCCVRGLVKAPVRPIQRPMSEASQFVEATQFSQLFWCLAREDGSLVQYLVHLRACNMCKQWIRQSSGCLSGFATCCPMLTHMASPYRPRQPGANQKCDPKPARCLSQHVASPHHLASQDYVTRNNKERDWAGKLSSTQRGAKDASLAPLARLAVRMGFAPS